MSDERNPEVSKRYAELGAEEPPRALDERILAASRRAVDARPAPLVSPGGKRRWYFPVAAAAVITLAVAVTLHVEREMPDEAMVASTPKVQAGEAPLAKREVAKEEPAPQKPAADQRLRAHPGSGQRNAVVGVEAPKPAAKPLSSPQQAEG